MIHKIKKAVVFKVVLVSAMFLIFIAPQAQHAYLRYEVGQSVVQVLVPGKNGGGTGFAVKAASGRNFIATNRHVCEAAVNGRMDIKQDETKRVSRKVIYTDSRHDLCLIEGDSKLDALDLASEPNKGDIHYIVGHPGLRQLTVSSGEYIGFEKVELLFETASRETCPGRVVELDPIQQFFTGREFICLRIFKSYGTTAVAYPGNSGSPVVNKFGNIIGVLFAGSSEQERNNFLVPVYELRRVLNKF